jgi:hypothetical protein
MTRRKIDELRAQLRIAKDLAEMCRNLEGSWRNQAELNEARAKAVQDEIDKLSPPVRLLTKAS